MFSGGIEVEHWLKMGYYGFLFYASCILHYLLMHLLQEKFSIKDFFSKWKISFFVQ